MVVVVVEEACLVEAAHQASVAVLPLASHLAEEGHLQDLVEEHPVDSVLEVRVLIFPMRSLPCPRPGILPFSFLL